LPPMPDDLSIPEFLDHPHSGSVSVHMAAGVCRMWGPITHRRLPDMGRLRDTRPHPGRPQDTHRTNMDLAPHLRLSIHPSPRITRNYRETPLLSGQTSPRCCRWAG